MQFEIYNKNPQPVSSDLIHAIGAVLSQGEPSMDQEYRLGVSADLQAAPSQTPRHKFDFNGPGFDA